MTLLNSTLQERFGLQDFRPLQREIIEEVLAGRSTVAILPTGGGKSLCYQLPALLLPGATIVLSPLISLMKDQVDGLIARGIPAVAINSHDTASEARQKLDELATGRAKIAFIAPERMHNTALLEVCRQTQVSLLAVDEAHCVSQWGHDFRPDYRYIPEFQAEIGNPPLLALTATARRQVRDDLAVQLGIEGARVFSASANRENLWLGLEACSTVAEKRAKVAHLARLSEGSTIIYVSSRKDAETWADSLSDALAEPVAPYHAGLTATERTGVQNRFMTGLVRVVVATNAFGMGIDKPDIRAVIHAGLPDSLEAYFQEVGRAGRDGLPAACTMVLVPGMDVKVREFLLQRENLDLSQLDGVFRQLDQLSIHGGGPLPIHSENAALSLLVISHLQELRGADLLQRWPDSLEVRLPGALAPDMKSQVRRRLQEHERQRLERFRRIRNFAYLQDRCRREYVLGYFGEQVEAAPVACCSFCHPRPLPEGLAKGAPAAKKKRTQTIQATEARPPHPQAEAILQRLKQWRRSKASALAVPPYVVFGDRDLEGIAAAAPSTLDELAACRGVGPHKLQQHGEELLAEIRAVTAGAPGGGNLVTPVGTSSATLAGAPVGASPDAPEGAERPARQSREEQIRRTGQLLVMGQTVAEIAGALARSEATVLGYMLNWVATDETDAWKQVVRRYVSPDDYRAIRTELLAQTDGRLRPVFDRLEERYTFEQIRLVQTILVKVGQLAPSGAPDSP